MSSQVNIDKILEQRFIELSSPMKLSPTGTSPKLKKLDGIKAIMYDFYGTLFISGVGDIGIDDGKSDANLMTEAITSSGIGILNDQGGRHSFEIYSSVVQKEIQQLKKSGIEYPEPDIRNVWRQVLGKLHSEGMIDQQPSDELECRISVEFEARMNPVWPVPKAVETLHFFKEQGMIQGIISNSQFYTPIVLQALASKSLSELGLSSDLLHWSFEEKMKKPGLSFYSRFLKKLKKYHPKISPSEVLYAGNDMLKDIYPAASLGMKTALFAGDQRSLKWRSDHKECKNLEPDIIFTEFDQLRDVIS